MIQIAANNQIRLETEGQAHYRRKRAEGKKPLEGASSGVWPVGLSRVPAFN